MKGIEIPLSGQHLKVNSILNSFTESYYSFKEKEKVHFNVKGPGTLKLTMRSLLPPIKNMNLYRQRIGLKVNGTKEKNIRDLK
ncbi:MAG: hypothetical protein Q9M39_07955 [Sulfurovum sp.]|nr:hypothetical protein [Sulfurovum sp.]